MKINLKYRACATRGAPGAFDRLLGTRMGAAATEHLACNEHGILLGLIKGEMVVAPLTKVVANKNIWF